MAKITDYLVEKIISKALERGVSIHIKADPLPKSDFEQAAENLRSAAQVTPSGFSVQNNYSESEESQDDGHVDSPDNFRGSLLLVSGILIGIGIGHVATRSMIR